VSGDPIRLGDYLKDAEVFEHPLLYIGRINPHYGHFIIESLSYWWALTEHLGNVKYLVHAHDASVFEISYVRDCMHAAGIDSERLIYSKRPLKIREIHVPQSAFQLNSHVFKKYREICQKIAEGTGAFGKTATDQPLYISRRALSSGVASYRGEEKLESFLFNRGVRVVHPQRLSFDQQVELFNRHRRILGILGSGMHNLVFSLNSRKVVYFTPHWVNPTCLLIDKCFGMDSVYVQSCTKRDRWRYYINPISKMLRLSGDGKTGKFLRTYELDLRKVLNWLSNSGAI
jgi:capsular polysaccharide biosynthesis protein